ncbi:UDP-N-acetylmuramoyl-tripeptide--D-alanyl-D-alanine ligase [Candidatus Trichorickettsia mobilis]|uniref:UDP-N-acetylmuramoyl-tripeptide--D-alanyl-D-alanine ligase n=1 Tax=Candidatus Trichorickettsia mobilis TaxID=1346319 RepID=A0ABZ0UT43_9RICK|nr:UDP-N-acetylmuramoyl-tripeptide--D-alanyl-D-alanine ligase [Candidatus Trichorickettsia mobilis]WPY00370.1 UDP-N-acetylmuramoyl-tripeptide--D-alanyl-D-alanine ligase [Candidatus Trichorickettsia mobilis]
MIWSASQLSEALGVMVDNSIKTGQVQFNSQDVQKNDLFIALKGNRNGHAYVEDAFAHGAAAAIVSETIPGLSSTKIIMVDDTMDALYKLAIYKRQHSKAKFIGVTGSVGKTTTKDTIKTMLGAMACVFASRGNFNNYLGVLINLASQPDDAEYAIFEMGMNHAGEIRELTKIVKPDIAVITSVSEAHLEFFNSVLDIVDAKCEIFEGLTANGTAVINLDSKYYGRMMLNIERLNIKSVYNFGKAQAANARLKIYEKLGENVRLVYVVNGVEVTVTIPFVPEHYARNFAAAFMVISLLKLDLDIAAMQLSQIELTVGRGKIIKARFGEKECRLLCDYYNANPESLKAAFSYLQQLESNKKMAIIGDMLELGDTAVQLHESVVPALIDSGVRKVILVGPTMQRLKILLPDSIESVCFDNVDLLCEELSNLIGGDELILIKGSRGMRLEKIVSCFKQVHNLIDGVSNAV